MEVITIESKAFKQLMEKLNALFDYVSSLKPPAKDEDDNWVDSREICDFLKISERTLQRLRTNGKISYTNLGGKYYYEWIEKNPFRNYQLRPEHNKDKDHLTKAELETLINKPMPNDRLERIRDVFTFCCLTGLAFTDADHLRPELIGADRNGTLWIHKPREKMAIMSRILLLPYIVRKILMIN